MHILIIGAGVAGLAAAQAVHKAGHRVTVVEARDRMGGRVWTNHTFASFPLEYGAEFVHGDTAITWQFLGTPEDQAIATGFQKPWRYDYRGHARPYNEVRQDPDFLPVLQVEAWQLPVKLTSDISAHAWVERLNLKPEAARFAMRMLAGPYLAEPDAISMQELVYEEQIHHAGHGNFRLRQGYDTLIEKLSQGITVQLNKAVSRVRWSDDEVEVTFDNDSTPTLRADKVIITVPLSLLQKNTITFDPHLPSDKSRAIQSLAMGSVVKLHLLFSQPFWDEATSLFIGAGEVLAWWSPGYQRPGVESILTAFITGKESQTFTALSEEEALERGIQDLCRLFGTQAPRQSFIKGIRIAWDTDPWAQGGYSYVPVGAQGAREILAQPLEPTLFFAGEATVTESNPATVHGAIESGIRAAKEVMSI